MEVRNGEDLLNYCTSKNISLSEFAIEKEMKDKEISRQEVIEKMRKNLEVMKDAAGKGRKKEIYSVSGLIGGDAYKLQKYEKSKKSLTGDIMVKAMAMAISSSEVNASMGRIVACPTAGSCGILPAVILAAGEKLNLPDEELIRGLFAAGSVGIIIGLNATLAGAEGGCQAECGSAAAMGAAALVELMGGSVKMSLDAAAIILQNILGLVCDPVAGLVEIPCAKRNVQGAVTALCTADLVMAGVESKIPFDDAVSAMYKVGKSLPSELRETAEGGIAATKEGLKLKEKVYGKTE